MSKEVLIDRERIAARVKELGAQITEDFKGEEIVLIGILKGSVPFMADLMREIDLDITIEFMQVSSYFGGTKSTGMVKIVKDIDIDLTGKNVIIVEDIVDSGNTLAYLKNYFKNRGCKTLKIATFLDKPSRRKVELVPDYSGFTIDDLFIVGYGLDLDQKYRQLPYISWVKEE